MDIIEKAGLFLQQNGRDIDKARFDYHFGSLSIDGLLAVLEHYQNADGGWRFVPEIYQHKLAPWFL